MRNREKNRLLSLGGIGGNCSVCKRLFLSAFYRAFSGLSLVLSLSRLIGEKMRARGYSGRKAPRGVRSVSGRAKLVAIQTIKTSVKNAPDENVKVDQRRLCIFRRCSTTATAALLLCEKLLLFCSRFFFCPFFLSTPERCRVLGKMWLADNYCIIVALAKVSLSRSDLSLSKS